MRLGILVIYLGLYLFENNILALYIKNKYFTLLVMHCEPPGGLVANICTSKPISISKLINFYNTVCTMYSFRSYQSFEIYILWSLYIKPI